MRAGETFCTHVRDAIIQKDDQGFWFKTREGMRFGPFADKTNAMLNRQMFIYQVTGDERLKPRAVLDEAEMLEVEEADYQLPIQEKSA